VKHRKQLVSTIMTGATCGAGNAYPSVAPDFTSGVQRGSCYPVICVSWFHVIVLSFGFIVLIVLFDGLLGIYIFYFLRIYCYTTWEYGVWDLIELLTFNDFID